MILASGPRQLVVHDALERMLMSLVYVVWLTPITNIGASADGAEMMTFFAPPCRCIEAFSMTVKMPVDSQTMSAPFSPHGTSVGFFTAMKAIDLPSMISDDEASSYATVP